LIEEKDAKATERAAEGKSGVEGITLPATPDAAF
jgi:hypothetical protein